MSDEIVTLKVRTTASFREKLALTAKENNRSMNAEIVARLEQSFENQKGSDISQLQEQISRMDQTIKTLATTLQSVANRDNK